MSFYLVRLEPDLLSRVVSQDHDIVIDAGCKRRKAEGSDLDAGGFVVCDVRGQFPVFIEDFQVHRSTACHVVGEGGVVSPGRRGVDETLAWPRRVIHRGSDGGSRGGNGGRGESGGTGGCG